MTKANAEIDMLAASLRGVVGCDDQKDQRLALEFWARESQRAMEPKCISSPDEYDGSPYLAISCTQTDLPDREQARLVETWCHLLPTLDEVQWLWFYSRVPQCLFDAACQIPALRGLYVKWSGIENLEPLTQCTNLTHLKLGSSPGIRSLDPLGCLTWLKWLQVDNVRAAKTVEPLQSLKRLEGLGFTGGEFKNYTIHSFEPLGCMTNLRWLHLGSVHTEDQSLKTFANLKNLEFLGLGNFFPLEEFAWLSLRLSPSVCEWLQPYVKAHSSVFPCPRCKANWKVLASGKRGRLLCPTCDSVKLARHVMRFNAAREAAKG